MAVENNNKAIIAFKNLLGKSQTDSNKELGNESEGIFFNVTADNVFTDNIDSNPSNAVSAGTAILVNGEFEEDLTSNGHGWFLKWPVAAPSGTDPTTSSSYSYGSGLLADVSSGDRIRNIISPSSGSDYSIIPKDTDTNTISPGDPRDWVFQYNSGIFWQQDNIGSDPSTGQVYAYSGSTLASGSGSSSNNSWYETVIDFLDDPLSLSETVGIGDRYIVSPVGASGDFTGKESQLAEWTGVIWEFSEPSDGGSVRIKNLAYLIYYYEGEYPSGEWLDSISISDSEWRNSVISIESDSNSLSPSNGDRFLVDWTTTALNDFSGKEGQIAIYNNENSPAIWEFEIPSLGWALHVDSFNGGYYRYISESPAAWSIEGTINKYVESDSYSSGVTNTITHSLGLGNEIIINIIDTSNNEKIEAQVDNYSTNSVDVTFSQDIDAKIIIIG